MSSFTISALCAVLSMCYTPSQTTRQDNSFTGTPAVQRVVAGSTYQITAQGTSFAPGQSWTLSSSNSTITNPTCTYAAEATNNQCTFTDVFTAENEPGTTLSYTAHDSVSNTNVTFSLIIAAAVPAQPSLAASTETDFIITSAAGSETCVIVSAASSHRYEATDLPAVWSGVWTEKPDYVTRVVFDNVATNPRTLTGLWSTVAAAGQKYDFHSVCYNSIGHSMAYSVYNLVAVGSTSAPAATVVSAASTSDSSFRVTFQSPVSSGARGFYPDNVPVVSTCTMTYGRSESTVSLTDLNSGVDHVFNANADLSVELPFSISCSVGGVASAAVQGRIAAVAHMSSSSGVYLSSSSAPVGFLSSSSETPVLLSSSSAVLLSSSSEVPVILSSSSSEVAASSTGEVLLSSSSSEVVASSTGEVLLSSTGQESSITEASSAAASSSAGASSSSGGALSSSSRRPSQASSSPVVAPIDNVPEGTVSVTFSIDLADGEVTEALVGSLHSDISANIAAASNTTTAQIKPFVIVTVGTMTSAHRRLLSEWVPVSFIVLGNITSVTGGSAGGAPSFSALSAATMITTALSTGTFVSTETAYTVPQQTVEISPVVAPERPSSTGTDETSSGTFGEDDDTSSSGISDGAIAGAVVGAVLGAMLLMGLAILGYRNGAFSKCFTPADPVTQANANEIVRNKGPLPISFEENVDMGYTDQPVRIHTDSPVAGPASSPATPPAEDMVYNNEANDANDVHVTIETRE